MLGGCILFLLFLAIVVIAVRAASGRSAPADSPASDAARSSARDGFQGWGYLGAVGESQYQPALRQVARNGRECWACLVPEPDNPFDSNAVMVQIDGQTVGYLDRSAARKYQRRLLPLSEPIRIPAKLIGGTSDKPSFGVLLDHREVERLPVPKRARKRKAEIPTDPDQPF